MIDIMQNLPNLVADGGATRLPRTKHPVAQALQVPGHQVNLRALARAIGAFKGDKQAHDSLRLEPSR